MRNVGSIQVSLIAFQLKKSFGFFDEDPFRGELLEGRFSTNTLFDRVISR